jgi:hypothetical protein
MIAGVSNVPRARCLRFHQGDSQMLSDAQKTRVWQGMIAAEIRAKYFAELSGRLLRRQR